MVAILANIRSLHNTGSIFRIADAAGVEKLYLTGITPSPLDRFGHIRPQVAKVALGAEKVIPWEKTSSAAKLIARLRKDGYKILAVEQSKRSVPYYAVKLSRLALKRVAIMVGNEFRGLPPAILKKCDQILEIPMQGAMLRQAHHPKRLSRKVPQVRHKESLNVAVAFGIVAFQLLR